MKKTTSILLITAMLLSTLLGCAAPAPKMQKLTLNEVTHSVFYAPLYAAIELGYFAKENIQLDLVNGGGSDKSMTAVLSGDANIGAPVIIGLTNKAEF